MKCPLDHSPLTLREHAGCYAHTCATCGGAWVPLALYREHAQQNSFDLQRFTAAIRSSATAVSTNACPQGCGQLASGRFEDIPVDWCRQCSGVWLGPLALSAVLAAGEVDPDDQAGERARHGPLLTVVDFIAAILLAAGR